MAKILVVDDDPDMRLAISSVLKSRSYEIVEARDGEEALARLKEEKPEELVQACMFQNLPVFRTKFLKFMILLALLIFILWQKNLFLIWEE